MPAKKLNVAGEAGSTASGLVVVYFSRYGGPNDVNVRCLMQSIAEGIAKLKGYDFRLEYCETSERGLRRYYVPNDTIVCDESKLLGITTPDDIFGGVVPQPFIKTKAIVHGLVDNNVAQPQGWCASFADKVRNVVLPGYTVFSADDARLAVKSLLETSQAVRLKRPLGATGLGQQVIGTRLQLEQFLESYSASELSTYGLVIEMNIREVRTLNVGQITIGGKTVSYYGTQAMTQNNEGATVYGGSNLICVRGGWSSLDALTMSPDIRAAVNKALAFDRAADDFPGILLSRRNYDVGVGFDESGHRRSGVFEQSWRFGGASTAELAAMAAFNEEADVQIVHVSTVKRFGKECKCPRGAIIHYRGDDPIVGPMIRYTVVTKVVRLGHFHQKLNGSFS